MANIATKQSLIINSVDQGNNSKQRAITDINPNTNRVIIAELGAKLNALTENTLVEATSVGKTDLDIAGQTKRTPTLAITGLPTTYQEWETLSPGNKWLKFDINYDGDGKVYYPNYPEWSEGSYEAQTDEILGETWVKGYNGTGDPNFVEPKRCKTVYVNGKWQLWVYNLADDNALIVKATDTNTCNAVTATATISLQ